MIRTCAFAIWTSLIFASAAHLSAETSITVSMDRTWNDGETVFEIGSKQPDITGIAGGSRITYPRDFAYTRMALGFYSGKVGIDLDVGATGHAVRSGTGRDEDFFLSSTSRVDGAKVSLQDGRFSDRTRVFSGGRNWADSSGKTALVEYRARLITNYFPWSDASPFHRDSGTFFALGFEHIYSKYRIYDSIQYNVVSVTPTNPYPFNLTPIGSGLSFTNVSGELMLGAGIALYPWETVGFSFSFSPLVGYANSRDFHSLRGITFIMENAGSGFLYQMETMIFPADRFLVRLGLTGHRFYASGTVKAHGLDLLYNVLPPQQMFLNTKEWGAKISLEYLL